MISKNSGLWWGENERVIMAIGLKSNLGMGIRIDGSFAYLVMWLMR